MKFSIRAESGKEAFFRGYHVYDEANPQLNEVAFDLKMELNDFSGITFGSLFAGNTNPNIPVGNTFTIFPLFSEFILNIDIDNDVASLTYGGSIIHTWPFSNSRDGINGTPVMAAVEFYSDGPNTDYVLDDFRFYANDDRFCDVSGGIYCEDFDTYFDGSLILEQGVLNGWRPNDEDGTGVFPGGRFSTATTV